jgi:putative SOS response-associated peptidase YedK
VVGEPDGCDLWFDHGLNDANGVTEMLAPFDALRMKCYPVSTRVNLVKNDEPDCAAPIQAAE